MGDGQNTSADHSYGIAVIQVMGSKNSGKTRLSTFLISGLAKKGYRTGSLKHSSHNHPLDKPGSDSYLHRDAGASPAVFQTPEGIAIFENSENVPFGLLMNSVFAGCDIVIVESFEGNYGPVVLTDPEIFSRIWKEREVLAIVGREGEDQKLPQEANVPFYDCLNDEIVDLVERAAFCCPE